MFLLILILQQNLVEPQGRAKLGDREDDTELNSSAKTVDELNDMPYREGLANYLENSPIRFTSGAR